jgi:hypothetical protein
MGFQGLSLIRTPNEKYVFVGKVPSILAFQGNPTEEQLAAARHCGGRFLPPARTFETKEEAVAAAVEAGFEVTQICG